MGAMAFLGRNTTIDAMLARLARARPHSMGVSALIGLSWAAGALFLRWAASSFYGEITGFMILLPAVVLAALAAGRIGGIAALTGSLLGGWALVGPAGSFGLATPLGQVATVNFVLVGLFTVMVAASLRKTVHSLDASVAALEVVDARVGETELELRAMVDQASAGIARVGLDGVVETANARFAEILGTTREALIGATTGDVTHPDDIAPTKALLDAALAGGAGQVEKRYYRPDGSIVWALTSLQRLLGPDGEPRGFIAVIVDISEAKQTEASLRESEERFRLMADTAPSPVWLTDVEGEVEFVNTALVEFYGQPAEAILGHVWKQAIHPDDVMEVAAIQAKARPDHLPYAFECRFQRSDGAWRWMRVTVNPRRDGQGGFQGYVGMSFDVTEMREAIDAHARQEDRQRFLLSLTDALRDMAEPGAVMAAVNRALGERLAANRVGFGELDRDAGVFRLYGDWTRDVTSNEGEWPIEDFGGEVDIDLQEGRLVVVEDVAEDPRTAPAVAAHDAIAVRAFVTIPLMRAGRLRAFLHVHSREARVWTADELGLIDEVAERAWAEVERTRAQAEVAESEARFRSIADTAPVLIWVTQQDRQRAFVNQAYVAFMGGDYESVRTAD